MVMRTTSAVRVKSGNVYRIHVSGDTERKAVLASEEGAKKGSRCVLGSSNRRW
jgi:hypothetical protein